MLKKITLQPLFSLLELRRLFYNWSYRFHACLLQRIEEHEFSKSHSASVEAFLIRKSSGNIVHLVDNSVLGIRKREIEQRGAVVQTLIRMVMFLGKQGLAFCGKRHEAGHELTDDDVNHGN